MRFANRIGELGQHALVKQILPRGEALRFNLLQNFGSSPARLFYYVFDVLVLAGRDVMGGRPPGFVQRDYLAVDQGLVRQRREGFHDGRIMVVEIFVVPRPDLHLAAGLERDGPVAVELQLVGPVRTLCQALGRSRSMGEMKRALDWDGGTDSV